MTCLHNTFGDFRQYLVKALALVGTLLAWVSRYETELGPCCTSNLWRPQVLIGDGVCVEPYAVVQAGARLEAGTTLGALRKAKSACVRANKDPLALLHAIGRGQKPGEDVLAAMKKCGLA